MKLSLTNSELVVIQSAVGSVVKAGTLKEKDYKPHSTDMKLLQVNRELLEKLTYNVDVMEKEKRITHDIDFNRIQIKVLAAAMLVTGKIQHQTLEEYEKRPDDHKSFSDAPGRSKADYVGRLKQRISEVNKVVVKIGRAV